MWTERFTLFFSNDINEFKIYKMFITSAQMNFSNRQNCFPLLWQYFDAAPVLFVVASLPSPILNIPLHIFYTLLTISIFHCYFYCITFIILNALLYYVVVVYKVFRNALLRLITINIRYSFLKNKFLVTVTIILITCTFYLYIALCEQDDYCLIDQLNQVYRRVFLISVLLFPHTVGGVRCCDMGIMQFIASCNSLLCSLLNSTYDYL